MSFVRMKQVYERGDKTSIHYVNLLPEELTLDPTYVASRFTKKLRTLFKEVTIVPPKDRVTNSMQEVFDTTPGEGPGTEKDLFTAIIDRLQEVLVGKWNSETPTAFLHSSGIDSRILSALLMRLRKERGDDWLGDVLFLCSRWEGDAFRKIMEYEGWAPDEFLVANQGPPNGKYYEWQLVDWRDTYKRLNGVAAIPVNLFWYPMEEAEKTGLLPGAYYTFTGYWGNTMLDAASGPNSGAAVKHVYEWMYLSHLCARPIKGSWTYKPFTDTELVRLIASAKMRIGKNLRPRLLEFLDPELAAIPEQWSDGDRKRRIADSTLAQMQKIYDGTWYGKKIHSGVQIPKNTEFHRNWSHWSAACLCEVLLENDYEIKVAKV